MLNCVYHVDGRTKNVEDEELGDVLSTGEWFAHPTEAKEMRNKCLDIIKERRKKDKKNEK